jgi:hypothetical protein
VTDESILLFPSRLDWPEHVEKAERIRRMSPAAAMAILLGMDD